MKTSICHYSFNRTIREKNWDLRQFAQAVADFDVPGIDFHSNLLGDQATAAARIREVVSDTGRVLTGLSISNNFNIEDPGAFQAEIDRVISWMRVSKDAGAHVSRIFGGHLPLEDRVNPEVKREKLKTILDAVAQVTREAETLELVLALENHGGLPCTGEEQKQVIEEINSDYLKATVDVGNFMQGCQEGHEGTAAVAEHAAYIHFKDFKKLGVDEEKGIWNLEACIVGDGDVDHRKCLQILKDHHFDGYVALEFEGVEGEETGIPKSLEFMKSVIAEF